MPKISQARRDARQQQILDAALACFSEDGFHQTGMADIVRRSGLSHGAVYLYFQSKDDLIEALAVDRHRQEALLNAAAGHPNNPVEALRNERVRTGVVEGIEAPRAVIVALIARAQSEGLLSGDLSADAIARTLIAVFQGFLLQAAWKQPIDVEACITVIDRMLVGLAPATTSPAPRRKRES